MVAKLHQPHRADSVRLVQANLRCKAETLSSNWTMRLDLHPDADVYERLKLAQPSALKEQME